MGDIAAEALPDELAVPMGVIDMAFRLLGRATANMSQAEMDYRGPAGDANSTATLLAHMMRTDLEYLHCIMGEPIPPELERAYPADRVGDDPALVPASGRTAAESLAAYGAVLDMVRRYLQARQGADAVRAVTVPWWPEPASVRYVLCHMAVHAAEHTGQIIRLRGWWRDREGGHSG